MVTKESLRTNLHILVRELGEPGDNCSLEKLAKFPPADKFCQEYCRQILSRILQTNTVKMLQINPVKMLQTNPVKVFLSPVESP